VCVVSTARPGDNPCLCMHTPFLFCLCLVICLLPKHTHNCFGRQKRPIIWQKRPIIWQKRPIIWQKRPLIWQKRPIIWQKRPIIWPKRPIIWQRRPIIFAFVLSIHTSVFIPLPLLLHTPHSNTYTLSHTCAYTHTHHVHIVSNTAPPPPCHLPPLSLPSLTITRRSRRSCPLSPNLRRSLNTNIRGHTCKHKTAHKGTHASIKGHTRAHMQA
jgi:hypothetical protein